MRYLLLLLALTCFRVHAADPLTEIKQLFDAKLIEVEEVRPMCVGEGMKCDNSLDCCGSAFCRDEACDSLSSDCREEGARCRSSLDCCGSAFCRDGYCSSIGGGCRHQGAKCNNSLDCCGSLFCRNGYCR